VPVDLREFFEPVGNEPALDVWLLGPEPFGDAHFAVFPTEVPRRCILAGTSEKGQCPECGAPWQRVVTHAFAPTQNPQHPKAGIKGLDTSNGWGDVPRGNTLSTTTGWRPTCAHADLEPVPQTVLDPFAGAGTTLLVADRLNRHAIGVELKSQYAEMARERIVGDAPMFVDLV
jgi:hypothetical protein